MHPNIVTVYDFSDDAARPFIAMEFVEGETLHAVLRRRQRLPVAEASRVVLQVLEALAYAHRLQIVHRDIKPANLILQRDGHVKVTDFGVARMGQSLLTHTGIAGTPSYMAPEQLSGGTIDGRTDLFATGAMLYEMLTGAKPFPGRDANEVMAMILHRDPVDPAETGAALPRALDSLLRRSLAKRAEQRFPSAMDFASALKLAVSEAMSPPPPAAAPDPDATVIATGRIAPESTGRIAAESTGRIAPESAGRIAAESTGPIVTEATSLASWDRQLLAELEGELAQHVGPIARVLVRQAARASGSPAELRQRLAPNIRDEAQRHRFVNKGLREPGGGATAARTMATAAMTGTRTTLGSLGAPATRIGVLPEQVAAAQEALTVHVGPIARVLVKQALAEATSARDFFARLAAHIRREDDRVAFRRKLARHWDPDFNR